MVVQPGVDKQISFFMPMKHKVLPNMAFISLSALIFLLSISSDLARGSELLTTEKLGEKSELQKYIIHVKKPVNRLFTSSDDLRSYHKSFLPAATLASSDNEQRLIYSYQHAISGFAARLTKEEVESMKEKEGFVAARPEMKYRLQTTHTPNFLGLSQNSGFWKDSNFGKGVIIGMLDSGVLPIHPSFSGKGMPPPPAKWKGKCEFSASECNNKLIGARSFDLAAKAKGLKPEPPLDEDGHGTHTASTAAGSIVKNADSLGNAKGTAVGMAPLAHLAIYKVCFGEDCPDTDILAGIDAAVEDGVDVISMSLVGEESLPFFQDTISVGLFAAMQKGIFLSCSAGNAGPTEGTLSNEAPWLLTVAASTTDRKLVATATLGNGEKFDGETVFQPENFPQKLLPLVHAGSSGNPDSSFCGEGAFNGTDIRGKVVVCERGGGVARIAKGALVKIAGGAAMILMNQEPDGFSTLADAHFLPATHVSFADGQKIKEYINSTKYPTAAITFKGTAIGDKSAPAITSFSSRGPNLQSPGILKPDITGPGVNILAAWALPLNNITDPTSTFNVISGTSMSCPHLSGIAALLKSAHPYWSPAAIKSAIMTSADIMNVQGKPVLDQTLQAADIFATGAGHVNPSKANDPGLIYDIHPDDYIPYLCGLGYKDDEVSIIAHKTVDCSKTTIIPEGDLNYPSFSVALGQDQTFTFTRTVTNVGDAYSSYSVKIHKPWGVDITVKPDKIYFSQVNQKVTYSVTFSRNTAKTGNFSQGFLQWVSSGHVVRSAIAVIFT